MKKKMTILAVLVAAVAITSYSVAGTYAKYTSTSTASDTARVAKWGIGVTNKIENLFANSYILDEQDNDIEAKEAVIAPGASGHYSFQFTGENAPEVAYKLKATVNITDPTGKLKFFIEKADYNKETFSDDLGSFKLKVSLNQV